MRGWSEEWFFSRRAANGVVAAHCVAERGELVVAWFWFAASGGRVCWVDPQSM